MIATCRTGLLLGACASLAACASARHDPGAGSAVDAAVANPDARVDAASQPGSVDAAPTGCATAFTGTLATWSFASQPGTQASTPVMTTATGITAGGVQRAAALTAVSGANSINSSGWPTAAQADVTKYYALTLAPPSGCMLSITALAIDAKASGTGPATAAIATSLDAFAQKVTISTSAASTPALAVTHTGSIELRIYGYSASATGGTLRLQDTLSVTGSLH